jgi:hypothetical protein
MSQGNPPSAPSLTSDQLQAIRDADAMAGEDLQNCPAAWVQRRELLAHIDALTAPKPPQVVVVLSLVSESDVYPVGVYTSPENAQAAAVGTPHLPNLMGMQLTVDAPLVTK